ncbi:MULTISPECIES: glycine-rich domain-containing protein [unclassified Methylobacterium]|uniref:glycine-rich domain-containing protein n=1 Tax=unclassified Methylobacterium TaxID=2615210 RepID=UPI00226A211A|nr:MULTISPECIES: hypothetical protein [unclassified Methylobacterium]
MRKHYPLNSNGAEDAGQLPWTDGVPSTGAQGSYPGHAIVTDVEAEILAAVDAAGLTRNGADLTQVVQAISRGVFLGTFTGSANALAATIPNSVVLPGLLQGMRFAGVVTSANTGGVTVALTGFNPAIGVLSLLRRDGTAMQGGDLPLNAPFDFRYDGSAFRLVGPAASELSATSTTAITQTPVGKGEFANKVAGSYTFIVPSVAAGDDYDVYWLFGEAVGGGGGATGGNTNAVTAGAGGGAGGTARGWFAVTPGQAIPYVVGAPGAGAAYQGQGGNGGTSSISTLMQATGGGGAGSPAGCAGGPGGVGSGGQEQLVGGAGNDGNLYTANSPGGLGGSSSLGGGGRTATGYAASVSDGQAPGSGGGGIYATGSNSTGGQGGNGKAGQVSFKW